LQISCYISFERAILASILFHVQLAFRLVVLEVLASCLQLRAQTSDEDTGKAAGGVVASDNIMCVVGEFSSALERLLPSLEQVNDLVRIGQRMITIGYYLDDVNMTVVRITGIASTVYNVECAQRGCVNE
jgi:hypothetical protein